MSSHHPSELDSVASSPRSDHIPSHDDATSPPRVRFMCSFGGKILPRPHDNQLRYVSGETRIVAVSRHTTFHALLSKLSKLASASAVAVKYQLPNEDLDALISVTTDEDVENMMEEYERFAAAQAAAGGGDSSLGGSSKAARLRLFLFPIGGDDDSSRASSISSLLDGSTRRDWFFDALNGGGAAPRLERERSEASSIVSEVPDYLFGLDNPEDPREVKLRARPVLHDNISASDPGSPMPPLSSSPFCSTSSSPCLPNLPPVRTKPESPITASVEYKEIRPENPEGLRERVLTQQSGYTVNPMWQYAPNTHFSGSQMQPAPVYYVQSPVPQQANVAVQPVQIQAPYVQTTQVPVGYHQAVHGYSGGGVRMMTPQEAYEMGGGRVVGDNQQMVYYGRNAGMVPLYPGMGMGSAEESEISGSDQISRRV